MCAYLNQFYAIGLWSAGRPGHCGRDARVFIDANLPAGHIAVAQDLITAAITQGTELMGTMSVDDPSLFTAGKGYLENTYMENNANPLSTGAEYQNLVAAFQAANNGANTRTIRHRLVTMM